MKSKRERVLERALEMAADSISGRFCDECPADDYCPLKLGDVTTIAMCRETLKGYFISKAKAEGRTK